MTETQPSPVTTNSLLQKFYQKKKRERIYVATKSDILLISTPSRSEKICKTPTTLRRICNYTQIKHHALSAANHPVDRGV